MGDANDRTLYVGGIHKDVTEEMIFELFLQVRLGLNFGSSVYYAIFVYH